MHLRQVSRGQISCTQAEPVFCPRGRHRADARNRSREERDAREGNRRCPSLALRTFETAAGRSKINLHACRSEAEPRWCSAAWRMTFMKAGQAKACPTNEMVA